MTRIPDDLDADPQARHKLVLKISELTPGGLIAVPEVERINLAQDIEITVDNPAEPAGVTKYLATPQPFQRLSANNDNEDFRWIIDLENTAEMHGAPLSVKRTADNGERLAPMINISHGIFYAAELGNQPFFRRIAGQIGTSAIFGKAAKDIGLDINLNQADSAVLIRNIGSPGTGVTLRKGKRYAVEFINDCEQAVSAPEEEASRVDLSPFYRFVRDTEGTKFELFDPFGVVSLSPCPYRCEPVILGQHFDHLIDVENGTPL